MLTLLSPSPLPITRTVILGAGGFVGQACAQLLAAESGVVLGLSRRHVDLLAPDAATQLAEYLAPGDTLIMAAAHAPAKDPRMLIDNLRMLQAVCAAVQWQSVAHLVYISSDAVYRDSPEPLTESSCAEPASLHGGMHLMREIMLRTELPAIPLVCVRPTLIYGPGDPHNGYGPNRFLRQARAGQPVMLFGNGEERRDHVHIDDVAEVVRRCVQHRATGIVNAVTGDAISFRAAAELAVELTGSRSKIVPSPRVGPMPHGGYRPFDASLLRNTFPGMIPHSLRPGLEKTIAGLRPSLCPALS